VLTARKELDEVVALDELDELELGSEIRTGLLRIRIRGSGVSGTVCRVVADSDESGAIDPTSGNSCDMGAGAAGKMGGVVAGPGKTGGIVVGAKLVASTKHAAIKA
jgi:hypothetical protein